MADQIRRRHFTNTIKALAEYDAGAEERAKMWARVESKKGVLHAEAVDQEAASKVQKAFYEDTSDFNRLDSCMSTSVQTLRWVVQGVRSFNEVITESSGDK
jgi:hypothetical protein